MKNSLIVLLLLIIFFVLSFSSYERDTPPLDVQLKEAMTEEIKKYQVLGASAAIVLPDGEVLKVTAGYSHDTVTIKPDMLFAIGSITKNMVATLILKLSEEGVLALDDPLYKWLPDFPYVDNTITIKQLLNHTSGLYMFWDNQALWDDLKSYRDSIFSPETVLTYLKEPYFEPGSNYRYSNTNYLLLAMIITKATDSSLSKEFRVRFWEPLEIHNTFLSMEENIPPDLAHIWGDNFENDSSIKDLTFLPRNSHESITYGSAGLFMTAEDLAKWALRLFQGDVLSEPSLNQMLDFGKGGYGLGAGYFRSILGGGTQAVGHMGGNIGTTASMIYSRNHKISMAVMINSYNTQCISDLSKKLGKIILSNL